MALLFVDEVTRDLAYLVHLLLLNQSWLVAVVLCPLIVEVDEPRIEIADGRIEWVNNPQFFQFRWLLPFVVGYRCLSLLGLWIRCTFLFFFMLPSLLGFPLYFSLFLRGCLPRQRLARSFNRARFFLFFFIMGYSINFFRCALFAQFISM